MIVSWDPSNNFPDLDNAEYDAISMRVGPDTLVVKAGHRYKKNPGCYPRSGSTPMLGTPSC